MSNPPQPIATLVKSLKRLPGVGEKTATRFAFHILNADGAEIEELIRSISEVKQKLGLCSNCFHLTDTDPCRICSDPKRSGTVICVVETPLDLMAVEKAGEFKGLYHVLHGLLSPIEGIGPDDIKADHLTSRIGRSGAEELILALDPTVEGDATAAYIKDLLKGSKVMVSRIGFGIPMGGSLEYSDPLTLARALQNRSRI
jgi:recombination protein RecR